MTRSGDRGQVLILAAIGMIVLLAAAGLAVDVGRLTAERRHLQTAADAAALAACQHLTDGSTADAVGATDLARRVAEMNMRGSPAGVTGEIALTPAYADEDGDGFQSADELQSGIVVSNTSARVAIRSTVPTVLARVVGVGTLETVGRAHCQLQGQPAVPIVARRYANPPGPGAGFVDHMATATTSGNGEVDPDPFGYGGVRQAASDEWPGPEFSLYGTDSKANNDAEFRGFVALDVRDFVDELSRDYYNGVTSADGVQTLKDSQGAYLTEPYPGPAFPPVTGTSEGLLQVGTLSGHSTNFVAHRFQEAYDPGDRLLLALYNGSVNEIPDFAVTPPQAIVLPADTAGTPVDGASLIVSRNSAFSGMVSLSLLGDAEAADPTHNILPVPGNGAPAAGTMNEPIFNPDDLYPTKQGTTVEMEQISTNAVPVGIYTVWLKGSTGSPYPDKDRLYPVSVHIGAAVRDFSFANSTLYGETTLGATLGLTLRLSTAQSSKPGYWGSIAGDVTLSWDPASFSDCLFNPTTPSSTVIAFSDATITPSHAGQGTTTTLNVTPSGIAPGCYGFTVRGRGTNGDGQPVTHLARVTFIVDSQPSSGKYVDVIGYGMFEVMNDSGNTIRVRAVSPICGDPACDALRQAQRPRLVPWS
jgi:Flp pilus assembly protein TadG